MKAVKEEGGKYYGEFNGESYVIQDDKAAYFFEKWKTLSSDELVDVVLADKTLWETDLTQLAGFAEAVKVQLQLMLANGVYHTLKALIPVTA